ncbi:MAG: helix-turn-helix transcriptional regulator [Ruminococcus sp.]|nr:helix-turn-helix transcriptional regulator [Ruminococcus sp.]
MNNNEFGTYLKQKRTELGFNQRVFAKMVGISYSYISSIETGKRPAPSEKVLEKMEYELKLKPKEREVFEHLAAKSRAIPVISPKIVDYVNRNDCVFQALSFAESNNIEEREWQEFLNKMRKRYY